jgi:hypothetical protein
VNRLEAARTVAAHAGQQDAHGVCANTPRRGMKQDIHGRTMQIHRRTVINLQCIAFRCLDHGHLQAAGGNAHHSGFEPVAIAGLAHVEGTVAVEMIPNRAELGVLRGNRRSSGGGAGFP